MSRVIWIVAWVGAAFWSFGTWIASGVLGLMGDAARRASGYTPGFQVEPLSMTWLVDIAHGLGGSAILFVWLLGLAFIFGGAWIVTRFLGRSRRPPSPARLQASAVLDRIGFKIGRKLKKALD